MEYYTSENTDGYTVKSLAHHNHNFPIWAKENGFDLECPHNFKYAQDAYWCEFMANVYP